MRVRNDWCPKTGEPVTVRETWSRRRLIAPAATGIALALAGAVSLPAPSAHAAATDGRIRLTAKSADVGVGWTWGNGVLHWRGHNYPFTVKGLNVAAIGYSTVTAHGEVHNLKHLQDFDGTYASSTGNATVGQGVEGQALINGNGVKVVMSGRTKGARLSGSVDGIQMTLVR